MIGLMARAGAGAAVLPAIAFGTNAAALTSASGYRVSVRGGFAREVEPDRLQIRALCLQPAFRIKAAGPLVKKLHIDLVNVHGNRLEIASDQIDVVARNDSSVAMALDFTGTKFAKAESRFKLEKWETLNFAAFSDTHLGDVEAEGHFSKVLEQVNLRRPTFAVDAGDIIDVDEPAQWAVYRSKELLLDTPLFTTIGNHDSYLSTKLYKKHLGSLFYSFEYDGNQFLFLDNAQKYNNATLNMTGGKRDAQWKWLRERLGEQARHRFVFFHFPVYGNRSMLDEMYMQSTTPAERGEEVDEMISLFKKSGVDYILFGHLHSHNREERDGIVHLRLGGGGGSRASHTDDRDVNVAHIFIDSKGIREYVVYPYFHDSDVKSISFCEAPGEVPAGADVPLIVNATGNNKLYAIVPEIQVLGGHGRITGKNIFTSDAPGRSRIGASYGRHHAEAEIVVSVG